MGWRDPPCNLGAAWAASRFPVPHHQEQGGNWFLQGSDAPPLGAQLCRLSGDCTQRLGCPVQARGQLTAREGRPPEGPACSVMTPTEGAWGWEVAGLAGGQLSREDALPTWALPPGVWGVPVFTPAWLRGSARPTAPQAVPEAGQRGHAPSRGTGHLFPPKVTASYSVSILSPKANRNAHKSQAFGSHWQRMRPFGSQKRPA